MAYFIQKNLPEAFPDWVGALASEMVKALDRASQTIDPCTFLEAFRDLLKKHQSRNQTVLSSMIANRGSPRIFERLTSRIAFADKDLYRFGWLYQEVAELVTALAPAECRLVKKIKQELEVSRLILREAPRKIKRQGIVRAGRRSDVKRELTTSAIYAIEGVTLMILNLIRSTSFDQLALNITGSIPSQYRSVVGIEVIVLAILILKIQSYLRSDSLVLEEKVGLALWLFLLVPLLMLMLSVFGWLLYGSIVAFGIAIARLIPATLAIKRTVDTTVDHYLAKVRPRVLPAVVVAISLQPDSTVDEIKDFAWRFIWRWTGVTI